MSSCSYVEFFRLREQVGGLKDSISAKNKMVKDLSYVAYSQNIISGETYNKLNFLTKDSTIQNRRVWLSNYLRITFAVKNKMVPFKRNYKVINIQNENTFSTESISRFSKITRRKLMFQKYDENQIVLLAQVMKKASQRMGVDPDTKTSIPYLIQEFNILNGRLKT